MELAKFRARDSGTQGFKQQFQEPVSISWLCLLPHQPSSQAGTRDAVVLGRPAHVLPSAAEREFFFSNKSRKGHG